MFLINQIAENCLDELKKQSVIKNAEEWRFFGYNIKTEIKGLQFL